MCLWGSSTPIFHTQPSYTQTSLPYTLSLSLSLSFSLSLSHSLSLSVSISGTHTHFSNIDSPTLSTLCLSASLRHSQPSEIHSLCTLCLSQTLTPFRHPFLMYSLSLSDSHTFQTSIPYVLSVSLRLSHLSDIHSLCTLCLSQTLTPFRHPFLMYSLSLSDSHTFQTQTSIPYVLSHICLSQTLTPFRHRIHSLCTCTPIISVSQTHIFHTQTSIPYVLSLSLSLSDSHTFQTQTSIPYVLSLSLSLSDTHLSHTDIHSLCTSSSLSLSQSQTHTWGPE